MAVAVAVAWLSTASGLTVAAADDTPSMTLRGALEQLQREGMPLVFSNALVRPDARVDYPVDPSLPLADRATALLAPFGLRLDRSGGVYFVVRGPASEPPADREPAPPDSTAPVIEEVVVTSSRYRLVRAEVTGQRLGQLELQVLPSLGRDVLRAVSYLPGQASVGVSARHHMRGGDSDEVLYRVDDQLLVEPFHMGDFHALFSTVNPSLVDSVDVHHAGFPASYGSRMSGIVDVRVIEPERPWQGTLSADSVTAAAYAGGQAGAIRWLASGRRSTVDRVLDLVEQDYGQPVFHDALLRVTWDGERSSVMTGALLGRDEIRLADESGGETARSDFRNAMLWVRGSHDLSDGLSLHAAASLTDVENRRDGNLDDPFDAVGALDEEREFSVAEFGLGARWAPAVGWLVDVGLDGQWQTAQFDLDLASVYGELAAPLQADGFLSRRSSVDRDGSILSGYLSVQQPLGAHWRLEYGLRYDLQDADPVHDAELSPRFAITWARPAWRAYLSAGRYAQHQNLYELQLDDGLLELQPPQLSDQLALGIDWQLAQRFRLRVEGYGRRVRQPRVRFENLYNRWVLLPELHADRVRIEPESVRTFGLETSLDYQVGENLRWTLSFALAEARERLSGDWRPRPWEQRQTVVTGLDWRPGRWEIGLAATWHGGWPTTARLTEPPVTAAALYDTHLPDYFSLDVHVARRFPLRNSTLKAYFDLSNATLADHVGGYRYRATGSAVVAEDRLLLPAIPVVGVEWSW